MNIIKKITLGIMGFSLFAIAIMSCSKKNNDTTTTSSGMAGEVVTNLTTISQNFAPTSLETSTASGVNAMEDSNPCAGTDLFGCQPRLLKLYIQMGKQFFDMTYQILSEISRGLGDIPDGGSGTHQDGTKSFQYKKTSSTNFSVLGLNGTTPFMYLNVNGSTYTTRIDFAAMPTDMQEGGDGPPTQGAFETVVNYTDENTWDIVASIIGMACQANDVRAPRNLRVRMAKANGLWTGKAMLYNGVWASFQSEPTCNTAAADNISMNMYTDFVANDTAAKASVYMMKRDTSAFTTNSSYYSMSNLCNSYYSIFPPSGYADASACNTALNSANSSFPISSYPNPFCSTAPTQATWNSDCTGIDSTIQAASFGAASLWTAPNTFYTESITLPSTVLE